MQNYTQIDPVFHWIELDEDQTKLLEIFKNETARLRDIQNISLLNMQYKSAEYSKLNHHIGFNYVVGQSLNKLVFPKAKSFTVKLAAAIYQFGHLPFSAVTEKAIAWGSNENNIIKDQLNNIIQKVYSYFPAVTKEKYGKPQIENIKYYSLFRWFSLFKYFEGNFKSQINSYMRKKNIRGEELDYDFLISLIINVDGKYNRHRKYFESLNRFDYVLRDFYHLGTAKLDLNFEMYINSLIKKKDTPNVEKLIDAGREYLRDVFYENDSIIPFYKIFSTIICDLIISDRITILKLLSLSDDNFLQIPHFKKRFEKYIINPYEVKSRDYYKVLELYTTNTHADEFRLLKKIDSYRNPDSILLSPLNKPYLFYLKPGEEDKLCLFIDKESLELKSILKLYKKLSEANFKGNAAKFFLPILFGEFGYKSILDLSIIDSISVDKSDSFLKSIIKYDLEKIVKAMPSNGDSELTNILKNMLIELFEHSVSATRNLISDGLNIIIANPNKFLKYPSQKFQRFYSAIIGTLEKACSESRKKSDKGKLLEIICLLKALETGWSNCQDKIVLPNVKRSDKSGKIICEYDLIIISIMNYFDFEISIIESSIDNSSTKEIEDARRMNNFTRLIRNRFQKIPKKYFGRFKNNSGTVFPV